MSGLPSSFSPSVRYLLRTGHLLRRRLAELFRPGPRCGSVGIVPRRRQGGSAPSPAPSPSSACSASSSWPPRGRAAALRPRLVGSSSSLWGRPSSPSSASAPQPCGAALRLHQLSASRSCPFLRLAALRPDSSSTSARSRSSSRGSRTARASVTGSRVRSGRAPRAVAAFLGASVYVEQCFAISLVFEPLVGELFRSGFGCGGRSQSDLFSPRGFGGRGRLRAHLAMRRAVPYLRHRSGAAGIPRRLLGVARQLGPLGRVAASCAAIWSLRGSSGAYIECSARR